MNARFLSLTVLGTAFALVHCSSGNSQVTGAAAEDAGVDSGDANATLPSIPTSAESAKAACQAYIGCLNDSSAPEVGATVALYGEASNCWKGSEQDALTCGKACAVARERVGSRWGKFATCGCKDSCVAAGNVCIPSGRCVNAEDAFRERMQDADACRSRQSTCSGVDISCNSNVSSQCQELVAKYFECGRQQDSLTCSDVSGFTTLEHFPGCQSEAIAAFKCQHGVKP